MEPKILYEDKNFVVLDKPSGWIVNEAVTTSDQPVVQNWLKKNLKSEISDLEYDRSGVVHRLDKETSGILLVAKNPDSFKNLQAQFKRREVKKTYIALVHDKVEPQEGTVVAPLGRLPWRRDRFGVLPGGRESVTNYKVSAYYMLNSTYYTLLNLYPATGRTHQIRVHLKHIRHPVVSDEAYAGRKTARNDRVWCPRLFLHASEIEFKDPNNGKKMHFKSELTQDLNSVLKILTKT